jgi:PncC family amidohydrolase
MRAENRQERVRQVADLLLQHHLHVATAESCTGGSIAAALTSIAGSSGYMEGGLVAYQNQVKEHFLHVRSETIASQGVVSEAVVREMVVGACAMFGCDVAIATSGCAGPGGGTDAVPVGTIWMAAGTKDCQRVRCLHRDEGRTANIENATDAALELLHEFLKAEAPSPTS